MTKWVAKVTKVLQPGIHKIGTIEDGEPRPVANLPLPTRVEIECDGGRDGPCMMYRFNDADEFCGDTWHESVEDAFSQAEYEYGLDESDFTKTPNLS